MCQALYSRRSVGRREESTHHGQPNPLQRSPLQGRRLVPVALRGGRGRFCSPPRMRTPPTMKTRRMMARKKPRRKEKTPRKRRPKRTTRKLRMTMMKTQKKIGGKQRHGLPRRAARSQGRATQHQVGRTKMRTMMPMRKWRRLLKKSRRTTKTKKEMTMTKTLIARLWMSSSRQQERLPVSSVLFPWKRTSFPPPLPLQTGRTHGSNCNYVRRVISDSAKP
mmetsp:Transcript_5600/g.7867  ORF Transcript_5600/g.7867 Transcript_5600/m.7867 type:complete len:221 (-) Transcript_5600:943-1605(-)